MMMALTDGTLVPPGKHNYSSRPESISVKLPEKADIKLLLNGAVVKTITGKFANFRISDNGVFRVEVFKRGKVWIYSNPFPVGIHPFF
jgi:hypothetical protein